MDNADLRNRFDYHSPPDEERREKHEDIREHCLDLALWLNELVPEGREKSLAITNLEQVMFWSNAALARPGIELKSPR